MDIIRFIRRFVVSVFLFILLATLCLLIMMKHIGSWDEVVLVNIQKRKQVEQIKERKVLLVGGSNLAYGIDSHLIEDSLQIRTYNMGIHAGIGLHYMLKEARLYLKKNDILVVVPEYNQFTDYLGAAALANMLIQTRRWSELTLYNAWDTYPSYFCSKVYMPFLLNKILGKSTTDKYADNPDGYDEKGDYTMHLDQPRRVVPRLLFADKPSEDIMKEIVDELNTFQKEDIAVIFLPPCYNRICYNMSKENIDAVAVGLQKEGRAFDALPERYCLNDTLFWNTAYHLSKEGRSLRTQLVIEDIVDAMKNK